MSTLVGLAMAEGMVRVFFPIYDGRDNLTLDGRPIKEWFEPGSVYRQFSNEYDARTTITRQGHRVPGTDGNPAVCIPRDSFTYGFGLSDDQTFASIYCSARHIECANLGMPGSGTSRQVLRLEQFIQKWNWRPREVKLFFFGMSSSFSAGNDFVDNYDYGRWLRAKASGVPIVRGPRPTLSLGERMISWQEKLIEHSTLIRRVKYHWGPLLKSMIIADPGDRMAEALLYTERGLQELDDLSRRVGFEYLRVSHRSRARHHARLVSGDPRGAEPQLAEAGDLDGAALPRHTPELLLRIRRTSEPGRQPTRRGIPHLTRLTKSWSIKEGSFPQKGKSDGAEALVGPPDPLRRRRNDLGHVSPTVEANGLSRGQALRVLDHRRH